MKHYVLVLAKSKSCCGKEPKFLVVRKHRPAWQRGRLNLVGGHVEENEDAFFAATRELHEETGLIGSDWLQVGAVRGFDFHIDCYTTNVKFEDPKPREGETEEVFWTTFSDIKDNPRLMPNLKAMIPMMLVSATDWVILDDGDSQTSNRHVFSIEVASTTENFSHEV